MGETFNDRVNEYYNLKGTYNRQRNDMISSIITNNQLSRDEKQEQINELQFKCISCQRKGGTIFTTDTDKETGEQILIAKCGDTNAPCELHIKLAMGDVKQLPDLIKEEEDLLKRAKTEVIELKNQLMVGIIKNDDVLKRFDELREDINTSNQMLEYYLELYTKIVANPDNAKQMQINETKRGELRELMRIAMDRYKRTQNPQLAQDAVEIYVNEFRGLSKEWLSLKYENMYIMPELKTGQLAGNGQIRDRGDDDNGEDDVPGQTTGGVKEQKIVYKLVQTPISTKSLEYAIIEPRVLQFNIGNYMPAPVAEPRAAKKNKPKTAKRPHLASSENERRNIAATAAAANIWDDDDDDDSKTASASASASASDSSSIGAMWRNAANASSER
jgi:hypothetical protein